MPRRAADRATFPALVALFVLSGACALVYEHLFHKLLGRTLGTSAAGAAAVLAAYMGGLGAGSLLGGRLAARTRRPFVAYAAVEAGVALVALAVPLALDGVTATYAHLAAGRAGPSLLFLRFVVACVVSVPPALLAGMTFPLGARLVAAAGADEGLVGRRLGTLYGANTLGAAAGVLASTYLLVPLLGTARSLHLAAATNGLLALTALLLARRTGAAPPAPAPAAPAPGETLPRWATLAGALASGLLGLGLEVVWFRLLAVVIGASVFAFGLMLFAFLVGNGLGGALAGRGRLGRAGPPVLVWLHLAIAAVVLGTLPLWDRVPGVFVVVGRLGPSFALGEAVRLACALALLLPPTVLLGIAFPLLFRLGHREEAARRVARVYFFDTAGAVAGALGTTFVLLPLLGARGTLVAFALLAGGMALLYARAAALPARRLRLALGAAAVLPLVAAVAPRWDLHRLASGANAYFAEGFRDWDRLLFHAEDSATGLITVVEKSGTRTLLTNGKFEGNDSFEVRDQYLFSMLPLLFVHRFDEAMNIGVGTGATLRMMAAFPFRRLEAVDLSREVFAAARAHFGRINGGVLDDPRVEIVVEDGRNRLLASRRRYDLISIELSSIWLSGTGELYNREFYLLARDRLAPGGVFQQWLQLHHISRRDLATVIRTLREVFPHVTLWVSGHQGVLVAGMAPLRADAAALDRWRTEPVGALVREAGLLHPWSALGHLHLDTPSIDRLIADVAAEEGVDPAALVSSDRHPRLEYSTPRGNLLPRAYAENLALLARYAMTRLEPFVDAAPEQRDAVYAYAAWERGFAEAARRHAARAGDALAGDAHAELRRLLEAP